jgi:hypothetical protein
MKTLIIGVKSLNIIQPEELLQLKHEFKISVKLNVQKYYHNQVNNSHFFNRNKKSKAKVVLVLLFN